MNSYTKNALLIMAGSVAGSGALLAVNEIRNAVDGVTPVTVNIPDKEIAALEEEDAKPARLLAFFTAAGAEFLINKGHDVKIEFETDGQKTQIFPAAAPSP